MAPVQSSKKRGSFIVIEGLDRSGKSTQAAALFAQCQASNIPVKLMKFPGQNSLHLPPLHRGFTA
jgi:dTMP kinase